MSVSPHEALDGARLVRFHDDGLVGAVWDGSDAATLYRVYNGAWESTGELDIDSSKGIDDVDESIQVFLDG